MGGVPAAAGDQVSARWGQVYVPWNLHEPRPGQFEWTGFADLDRFLTLAKQHELQVLLRPGPYICAEVRTRGTPNL
jgi:beta-galactosidase GanA